MYPVGFEFCCLPMPLQSLSQPVPLPQPLRYSTPAIALHWLLAIMLLTSFGVGFYMSGLSFSPLRLKLYNWHKWAGIAILSLSALRLLWRLWRRPPPLPASMVRNMPAWQQTAHHGTHAALYLLFFAVPLLGWAYSSAAGFPVVFLGLLQLPDFVPASEALADALKPWHRFSAYTLAALAVLHVAAALKHHLVDRDGLLARIGLPGRH